MQGTRVSAEICLRGKNVCVLDINDRLFITDGFKIEPLQNKDRAYMTLLKGDEQIETVQKCLDKMHKRNEKYVYFVIPPVVVEAMKSRLKMLSDL